MSVAEDRFRIKNGFPPDIDGLVGLLGLSEGDCPKMSSAKDVDGNAGDKRPATGDDRGREM